jgi:hypothetical protein
MAKSGKTALNEPSLLGVEVIPTPAGLFLCLSQHKEIRELLEHTQMTGTCQHTSYYPVLMDLHRLMPLHFVAPLA